MKAFTPNRELGGFVLYRFWDQEPSSGIEGYSRRLNNEGMELTSVDLLYQEWQWLVQECASAMRAGRLSGLSKRELRMEEQRYGLRIDAAYARLKQAEARSARSGQNL